MLKRRKPPSSRNANAAVHVRLFACRVSSRYKPFPLLGRSLLQPNTALKSKVDCEHDT